MNESTDFYASLMNYARNESLDHTRSDVKSIFKDIAIPVATIANSGRYGTNDTLACCWISIAHGFISFNEHQYADPGLLKTLANFKWQNTLVDTDNEKHLKCLETFSAQFPKFQFQFFIGRYDKELKVWFVTQDPGITFGNGLNIIRIINKGSHFEFITTPNDKFIRNPRTMTEVKAKMHQTEIYSNIGDIQQQLNDDQDYALLVQLFGSELPTCEQAQTHYDKVNCS